MTCDATNRVPPLPSRAVSCLRPPMQAVPGSRKPANAPARRLLGSVSQSKRQADRRGSEEDAEEEVREVHLSRIFDEELGLASPPQGDAAEAAVEMGQVWRDALETSQPRATLRMGGAGSTPTVEA